MNVVTALVIAILALAAVINVARALRRGGVIDRAIALDGVMAATIAGLGVVAVRTHHGDFADIALVGGLIGFMTLATVARYVGRRGD